MTYRLLIIAIAVLSFHNAAAVTGGTPLSVDYLLGAWSLDGKEACGSADYRYVQMKKNGTLEVGQGNHVTRVGFWNIMNEDIIVAHTLRAPTQGEEYHPFLRDTFRYERMAAQVLSIEPDAFSISVGSDLDKQGFTLTRCP